MSAARIWRLRAAGPLYRIHLAAVGFCETPREPVNDLAFEQSGSAEVVRVQVDHGRPLGSFTDEELEALLREAR